jgi:hypothetical protein
VRRAVLLAALVLCLGGGGASFGGFVGSASTSVNASVDSLAAHVTVVPSDNQLQVHNVTATAQSLDAGEPGGLSATFASTGGAHATLAPGATDVVNVSGADSGTAHVVLAVVQPGGMLFPSAAFPVDLSVPPGG